ncbi:MAG: hypothetical protein JWO76_3133 [Nocardioides sp.]|nr:hypothetical protein [Nocardioides sp.]
MPLSTLRKAGRAVGLAAALALTLPALAAVPAGAEQTAPRADATSPITLWAPAKITTYVYGKHVWTDLGLRLIAQGEPFELWSNRPSYDDRIHTEWRSTAGTVALPEGSMKDFSGLSGFFTVKLQKIGTHEVRTLRRSACLSGWSERVRPDAPATSPYPRGCYYNPYSLGSVQGIQEGWAAPIFGQDRPMTLTKGRYHVTATIAPAYAAAFGLSAADASRSLTMVVKKEKGGGVEYDHADRTPRSSLARPAAHEPRGTSGGRAVGPVPDLRSLPAWGIQTSPNGNFLQFSATVWNAGDSPLVVDGFATGEGETPDRMDAYQYFFDADGNQTGYQPVGGFEFDHKATHQHWHFRDFATYTLLRADKTTAVVSRKEAFCLANTDAVDLTVPDADWNPENTDLTTDCGYEDSLSLRQVLAAGWGDTYAQFRAGQSFDLRKLKNGVYYIATIANPRNRLIESSTDDNVALRKVIIGGKAGRRTVRVPQVGLVVEPTGGDGEGELPMPAHH